LIKAVKPDVVFHFAGQVAMTTSLERPRMDFEINAGGTLNLLEAVRTHHPAAAILYSSTNKVYGDLEDLEYVEQETRYVAPRYPDGFDESFPLCFRTPYGCSKGAADQYLTDYHHMFGLRTCIFRHSSIYGSNQFPTYDQGWVGWFAMQVMDQLARPEVEPFTISGDGKQVRDLLHASDAARLYLAAADNIEELAGSMFNIGGGMANSLSILELLAFLEQHIGVAPNYRRIDPRKSDQKIFVADTARITARLGWTPEMTCEDGITNLIGWLGETGRD